MWIQHLSLHYFRNLINNEFKFNNKKIIISGKNGTGKTSILEAIYLLSLGRSFRAKKDSNLIHYNSAAGNVAGNFVLQDKEKIDIHLHISNKKIFTINNKSIKRLSQLIGIVNTILFMDKDIDIIERAPELRRKFIDIIFSRVDRKYLSTLIKYYKTLEERNSFLRASIQDQTLLESLNSSLIRYGTEIICLRMNYLKQFLIILKGLIKSYDISIYGDITVKYHTDLFDIDQDTPDGEKDRDLIKKKFAKKLERTSKKEKDLKFTLCGPHRDDLLFFRDHKYKLPEYSSAGERRLLAILLRITEAAFVYQYKNEKPILLLDDILLELDKPNSELLMKYINGSENQFFITTTDESDYNMVSDFDLVKL